MTLPFAFPDWLPWWIPIAVLLPLLLYALAFLAMPFSVLGLKGRLESVEARLDEIQGEIRSLALRLPEARRGGYEAPGRPAADDAMPRPTEARSPRPPIPPAAEIATPPVPRAYVRPAPEFSPPRPASELPLARPAAESPMARPAAESPMARPVPGPPPTPSPTDIPRPPLVRRPLVTEPEMEEQAEDELAPPPPRGARRPLHRLMRPRPHDDADEAPTRAEPHLSWPRSSD